MVYVDDPVWPYGRMMMCHMMADSIDELNSMADKIGVQRRWFQHRPVPHYDICKSKRALAVQQGAVESDRRKIVEIMRAWRSRQKEAGQ